MKGVHVLLFVSTVLFGCQRTEIPNYTKEPILEFVDVNFVDTVDMLGNNVTRIDCSMKYKDGDSDLGFLEINQCDVPNGRYELLRMGSEDYELYDAFDFCFYEPQSPYDFIDGLFYEIVGHSPYEGILTLKPVYTQSFFLDIGEKLKFTCQIFDKKGNQSNIAEFEKIYNFD